MSPQKYAKEAKKAQQHLLSVDKNLAEIINSVGVCDIVPHSNYFQALARSVIGQQLSVKAAATIRQRFEALGRNGFPLPNEVVTLSNERLREVGLSGAKATYIKDLASHIANGHLDLDRLPELPNEEIVVELTDVKGIGEWTAHMFLIFCLGRLDVLPTGDLGVRKGMQILYDLKELPSPSRMWAIAERHGWTGYESIASWYLWRSLDMGAVV